MIGFEINHSVPVISTESETIILFALNLRLNSTIKTSFNFSSSIFFALIM